MFATDSSSVCSEIVKDESTSLGIADDRDIVNHNDRVRPVWSLTKVHRALDVSAALVEHSKLAVVPVHGEKPVAVYGLGKRIDPAENSVLVIGREAEVVQDLLPELINAADSPL